MPELLELPGVARKTANVVLGNAFGIHAGVVVDTHVTRLSHRLGLSSEKTAEKIEQDLIAIVPKKEWVIFPHLFIAHGRAICKARSPLCEECLLEQLCPSSFLKTGDVARQPKPAASINPQPKPVSPRRLRPRAPAVRSNRNLRHDRNLRYSESACDLWPR